MLKKTLFILLLILMNCTNLQILHAGLPGESVALDSMLDVHAEGNISDGSAFFVITNNMINVGNKMADTLNIHMTPKTSDIQNSNDQYIDMISRSKPLSSQTTRQFTNPMISHNSRHSSQRIDNSFQDLARQHSQERISTNERLSRKKTTELFNSFENSTKM